MCDPKTDPVNSDLNVELTKEETDEFWARAYAMGLVIEWPGVASADTPRSCQPSTGSGAANATLRRNGVIGRAPMGKRR